MTLIAAIHVAKRDIGIEEGDYRALLERVTGKVSLRVMTADEHGRVLDEITSKGAARSKQTIAGPYGGKLQALWLSGWNIGLMRSSANEALLAFVKAQTGIDHTRFLRDAKDARKAVEALKKWLERGGIDWTSHADPKDCVIAAQIRMLAQDGNLTRLSGVTAWLGGQTDDKAKIALMQRLGTRIRSKVGA